MFGLPQQWKPHFAFAQPVPRGAMIKHLREFKADEVIAALPKAEEIWISMATIPMGWISAVGVCQYLHRRLLHLGRPLGAGLDRKSEFRKDRGAQLGPDFRLSEFYECYIDNYDEAEITRGDAEPKNGGWVQGLLEAAEVWGVPYSPDKRVKQAPEGVTLGAHIYGRAGIILPSAERSLLLIGKT